VLAGHTQTAFVDDEKLPSPCQTKRLREALCSSADQTVRRLRPF
jgi:D-ribose pyranose/furanose isomerase RbsD